MQLRLVECRQAASRSKLPGLTWAVNPYRGCAHSCAYCYAQDVTRFEMDKPWGSIVEVKTNIASRLKLDLERRSDGVFGIGTVTDPYQPIEKEYELTRSCLKVLKRKNARVSILTKSDLVLRDMDIIRGMDGAEVGISVGSTDDSLGAVIEPGAPSPSSRLRALSKLSEEGIRTYLMAAPIIIGVSDSEQSLASLVEEASSAGVKSIMWDKYNPKPLAKSRLEKVLSDARINLPQSGSTVPEKRAREILKRECDRTGMVLLDAF